jgi:hypothetical protein
MYKAAKRRGVKYAMLGGDQYYQDSLEHWIAKLTGENFESNAQACREDSLRNALNHMTHPSYRKFMAQIPTNAMLDDHDLTDGAGGRQEYYEGTGFKEEWNRFIDIQKGLFDLLQASRNPTPVVTKQLAAYSFIQDLGETAMIALDMRTEKHGGNKTLMAKDSQTALFNAIQALPHKKVYILLPVVPMRNCPQLEGQLLLLMNLATELCKVGAFHSIPIAEKALKYVADCTDDMNDSLTSECNKDFFMDLMKLLAEGSKRGVEYVFLSGDIHTGGTVEIFAEVDGHKFRVPLIISSPVGYDPMPELAEPILREKKAILIEHAGVKLEAVTGRFSTQRNFIYLEMNRIFSHPNEAAFIYEERIDGCRRLLVQDWFPDDEKEVTIAKAMNPKGPEASV